MLSIVGCSAPERNGIKAYRCSLAPLNRNRPKTRSGLCHKTCQLLSSAAVLIEADPVICPPPLRNRSPSPKAVDHIPRSPVESPTILCEALWGARERVLSGVPDFGAGERQLQTVDQFGLKKRFWEIAYDPQSHHALADDID